MTDLAHVRLPAPQPEAFASAAPFPHIVVDGVVDESCPALQDFPDPTWDGWASYSDSYQPNKRICSDLARIPPGCRTIVDDLQSPAFLQWLEATTGIPKLIPDPYLEGGGLHASGPGGRLASHTDFHLYPRLDLARRVNAILYLNPGWGSGDGGELRLEGSAGSVRSVPPELGRLVVFRTDDRSVHGFPEITAGDRWRRSIALYYYTAQDGGAYAGDTNTYWREHEVGGALASVRLRVYRALLFTSRAFSWLAHRANPNFER